MRNGVVVLTDYEVNPDTIGQFIGHVASRNVKIFEGDILEGDWGAAATVEWLENESGFALRLEDEQYENTVDWLDEGGEWIVATVVGTIHDQPEKEG